MREMREIGSEFWDVPTCKSENNVFPETTRWFLAGRCALKAIIKELKGCHTVSMPSWCCNSMIKPFIDAGMEVRFYPVYWRDKLVQEIDYSADVLLILDYFGYTSHVPINFDYTGVIIRDITHSVFSAVYDDADYYFGSLRKWCGIWTGGFVWTNNRHISEGLNDDPVSQRYIALRKRAMDLKKEYINNRRDDKDYLELFEEAETVLDNVDSSPAAERDKFLAQKLDLGIIRKRRTANAAILRNAFRSWLIFPEMNDTDCPLFVPIFVPGEKRNDLRQYLIQEHIYCPVHWPISRYHKLSGETESIYKNELSLVCDQRYTEDDMYRMARIIHKFMGE